MVLFKRLFGIGERLYNFFQIQWLTKGNMEFWQRIRVNRLARGRATFQSCGARTSRNK